LLTISVTKRNVPQRVQVLFPAVESHVNAIAAAIFGKPGMKRLMDVTNQMSDEPQCRSLLIAWRVR
jgi:hypothetical protein